VRLLGRKWIVLLRLAAKTPIVFAAAFRPDGVRRKEVEAAGPEAYP